MNGERTKVVVDKLYRKDGKLMNVRREERLRDDGRTEITETIDNGEEVKKKSYFKEKKALE